MNKRNIDYITIPGADFIQGSNTLHFRESNSFPTKFEWTLYINQGAVTEENITALTYDMYGNKTSLTDGLNNTTLFGYDSHQVYLASLTNAFNQTITATYDFNKGLATSITDARGNTTSFEYDILGRVTKRIQPDLSEVEAIYDDQNCTVTLYNELDHSVIRYYDGLNRLTKTEWYLSPSISFTETFTYNYLNRVIIRTDPEGHTYTYEYDSLGRINKTTNPDFTFSQIHYDDATNTTSISDENHHKKEYHYDFVGNLLWVKEYIDPVNFFLTQYSYDDLGNLTSLTDNLTSLTGFQESNAYNTKCEWTLYLDQGSTPEVYITTYTHDSYGNLTSVTNAEGHTTSFGYSGVYQYAYLTSRTDIVDGQEITVSATYDFGMGNQISRTCACGSVTDYEYDLTGRLTKVIYPLVSGEEVRAEYEIHYNDILNTVTLYNENDEKTVRYYDGLERMVREEIYKDTMVWAQWQYEYNYLDKPTEITDPLSRMYQYEYDSLGRVTQFINPDQSFRTMEYDDVTNTVTVKDENQHKKVYTFSWTGTPVSVKEYYGSDYYLTEYNYDKEGNLIKMIDPEQNITEYIYDSVFGITAVMYPDLTEQHFTYDAIGNIMERTDQNGNYITYEYDALSQLKEINYQDTQVSFTYDPAGTRASMVTPDVTTLYTYDSRNRLTQLTTIIDGTLYPLEYAYDAASNITQITYPDTTTVDYTYSLNNVESIQDYASFTYLPDGNLDEILYSNAVTTNFGYDSRGRIQNIHAYTSEDLLDLVYTLDAAGNITGIQNNFRTATQEWIESTESYTYDDLDRLISASNRFGTLSYTYDSKKRLSMTENSQNTPYMYDYDLLLSAGEQTFTYDSNGNTLTKSSEFQWVYHYNNANQLTQVDRDGQTFSHYLYDGDGNRIKKTEMNEDVQDFISTIYIYSGLDVLYEVNTMGTALYIYGPSGRIAKQTTVNNETNTFYYIQDHLGSTRLVTDSNGTPLISVEYYPFGRHEYSGSQESYFFTGKEKDATGLSYFGARYYDPETGRFLTRDPYTFLPDDPRANASAENLPKWLLNPQRFNRFSYAGNNPLRCTDLTGLSFTCIDPECQDLLSGEESSGNPSSEEASDDSECDEVCQRQREQEECKRKCENDPYIKELLKEQKHYKTKLKLLRIGSFFLCLGAGAVNVFLGIICATSAMIGDLDTELDLNRIEQKIKDMGCACAIP